jgi:hypothetical protein
MVPIDIDKMGGTLRGWAQKQIKLSHGFLGKASIFEVIDDG